MTTGVLIQEHAVIPILFALLMQTYTPLSTVPNCAAFAPVAGGGYDSAWNEYTLTADGIAALLALDTSDSFWIGYDNGGFAMPRDTEDALRLTLYTADGVELWFDVLWSAQTPDRYYALPFAVTEAYADAGGDHYGTHPCAAFVLTGDEYAALIDALEG